VHDADRLH